MKKALAVLGAMAFAFISACGGSDTPADPTSAETKAAADAAMSASTEALIVAIENGGFLAQVFARSTLAKGIQNYDIGYNGTTEVCTDGGRYIVQGVIELDCTESESWTCTIAAGQKATIDFQECKLKVTKEGETYNVTLESAESGFIETTITGTVSGNLTELTSVNMSGELTGDVDLFGDLVGTADLSEIGWSATASESEPDISCQGTSEITLTEPEESTETCTVSSTCDGCTI